MRATALFVLAALLVGCGDDDSSTPPTTIVDRTRPVPAEVQAFLGKVADEHTKAFDATYHVLRKLGGEEHTVVVHSDPPVLTIEVDGEPVDPTDEAALSAFGIFSGFMTSGPAKAIEAAAKRADADPARFSTRTAAQRALECVEIPLQDTVTSTWCLDPSGIFGYVDTPAVTYELTLRADR